MARAAKLSVSAPGERARAVRKRVGTQGLSGFVARAMRLELEREKLGAFLIELDEELGLVPDATLAQAKAAWLKR